jgi:transposase InsO family protein
MSGRTLGADHYLRVVGWGWYYLSTVMDDFSRFILSYRLSPTMGATDVTETLDDALARPNPKP